MADKKFSLLGAPCGTHASYVFYKAIKYESSGTSKSSKILSLGEFFFIKIWPDSDIVSIGELQCIWEDKATNQILSSLRLYFLPEYTPEGRLPYHGDDEVVAVSEKAVLRVVDLLEWIAQPKDISWDRGLKGHYEEDIHPHEHVDKELLLKFSPTHSDFLADVRQEKNSVGDIRSSEELAVIILSLPAYGRYRSVLKRISGVENEWMGHSLILALGGFSSPTKKTFILFCRELFEYPELEEHEYLCSHLAPKLKGRPRKKKKMKRSGSPESESASSAESSISLSSEKILAKGSIIPKASGKKDLLSILSQKNNKEESDFLKKLIVFMEKRGTPIERPPMLGFKQIDLHSFYESVARHGGYNGCMSKKSWKTIYDDLGGNPQNTSAATCTRRHYEKFLLPYERRYEMSQRLDESDQEMCSPSPDGVEEQEVVKDEEDRFKCPSLSTPTNLTTSSFLNSKSSETECSKQEENEDDHDEEHEDVNDEETERGNTNTTTNNNKRLQIDDLIILPASGGLPPEGTALQNLAKIASRYQKSSGSSNDSRSKSKNFLSWNDSSKMERSTSSSSSTPTPNSSSSSSSLYSFYEKTLNGSLSFPDHRIPSPQSFLKYYENEFKGKRKSSTTTRIGDNSSSSSLLLSSSNSGHNTTSRAKVSKYPPETNRPPVLISSPCAFLSTKSHYAHPLGENKLRKSRETSPFSSPLDLSSGDRKREESSSTTAGSSSRSSTGSSLPPLASSSSESLPLHSSPSIHQSIHHHHLSSPAQKRDLKASPFSAESLLSKSVPSRTSVPLSIRGGLLQESPERRADKPIRSSPWHTPVNSSHRSESKPAIPVPPIVREKQVGSNNSSSSNSNNSSNNNSTGTGYPPPPLHFHSPPSHSPGVSSSPYSPYNPYLGLLSLPKPPGTPPYPHQFLDPATSAYYAALYSQQLLGGSHFSGLRPYGNMDALHLSALQALARTPPGNSSYPNGLLPGYPGTYLPPSALPPQQPHSHHQSSSSHIPHPHHRKDP